mgnify:CR=1 FL=1
MESNIDISIVVPLYNEVESLAELHAWIQRVMKENNFSYEVFICDNNSSDGSREFLKELEKDGRKPYSEIAKKVVNETTSIGLPQINAGISNSHYIDIPTTLMPDFISPAVYGVNQDNFGLTPLVPLSDVAGTFPVKFGTKHNASADLSISQLIFSGEYLIGLRAS